MGGRRSLVRLQASNNEESVSIFRNPLPSDTQRVASEAGSRKDHGYGARLSISSQ